MRNRRRTPGVAALLATAAVLAACTSTGPTPDPTTLPPTPPPTLPPAEPEQITLTWWHATEDEELDAHRQWVADEFEAAHPHVTVQIVGVRADSPRPAADSLPDVVDVSDVVWLADLVAQDGVRDLTEDLAPEIALLGATASAYQVGGRSYALPWSFEGFGLWYNPDVFAQAGIGQVPTTLDELLGVVGTLRAAGVTPIAANLSDGFTGARFWEELAVRTCPSAAWPDPGRAPRFDDPCFQAAGAALERLIAAGAFDPDAAGTPGGPTDAHALVATGQAAMVLSGTWAPNLMASGLEASGLAPESLGEPGWFPFPADAGAPGDPTTVVGDARALAVAADAPPEAAELVRAVVGRDAQTHQAGTTSWSPVDADAAAAAPAHAQPMLAAVHGAQQARLTVQHVYGGDVSLALYGAVTDVFHGRGSAQDLVDALNAAGTG